MRPVICLGFTAWKSNYAKSTIQILSRVSKTHPVLYIDYQYTIKDVLVNLFKKNPIEKGRILGYKNRLRTEYLEGYGHINVLSLPPVLPINWVSNTGLFDLLLKLNGFIISKTIKRSIKKLSFQDGVVVNAYNPIYGIALASCFKNNSVTYYCYDEISGSPWAEKHGARLEKRFFTLVDKVITTSESLKEAKSKYHTKVFTVKNGVDFRFFNDHLKDHINESPVIGYVGSLDERIDYQLLKEVAEALQEMNFVLIGRVVFPDMIAPINGVRNIRLLGPIAYDSLPVEVNKFDVCLIPFLKTKFTANIYPLKINEYLALGKPVIRTNFSTLKEFDSLIYTADTSKDFVEYIKNALKENDPDLKKRRIKIASENSWDKRVELFNQIIFG